MLYETLSSSLKLDYNTSYTISYFIKLYFVDMCILLG